MRSSRGRISSSPPKPAKSCSTTSRNCWRTATAGKPRSPVTWKWMRPTDDSCAEINRTDAECRRVLKPDGARMSRVPSSFEDELVDFVLEEIDELGGVWLTSGLEGVLMDDSGEITSSGVTSDMIDGSAAVAVASCDIIAAAFGRGPSELPDAIAQIVETH